MKDMLESFIDDHLQMRWNISYEYHVSNPDYNVYKNYIRNQYIGNKGDVELEVEDFFHLHRKDYIRSYVNIGLYEMREDDAAYTYVEEHLSAFKKEAVLQFLLYAEGKLLEGYKRQDPVLAKATWELLTQEEDDKDFLDAVFAKGKVFVDAYKNGDTKLKEMLNNCDMADIDDLYEFSSRIYQLDSKVFKKIAWKFLFQLHTETLGVITHFITEDFSLGCCPFSKMHLVKYTGLRLAKSLIGEKRIFFTLSIRDDAKVIMKICDLQALDNALLSSPMNLRGKVHIVKVNRKRKSH